MENIESLTFVNQTADSEITDDQNKQRHSNLPFDYSIENKIKNYLKGNAQLLQETGPLRDIREDFTEESIEKVDTPPYQIKPNLKYLRNYSNTLQSWKGNVVSIEGDFFVAKLEDMTAGGTKEIADIELMSVSPDDQKLVQVGATFYWNIGYKMNQGQITKESIIRFQRLINWDEEDYDNAADRASDLFDNINIE